MKDYDAYLFDWDGTLGCTIEVWLDVLEEVITDMGGTPDRPYLARTFGDWRSPLKCGVDESRFDEMQKAVVVAGLKRMPDVDLYPHAAEYLYALKKRNKKLALITSSVRETMDILMHKHQLSELFDIIITAHDVKAHKPDPEGLLTALEKLKVSKEKAVMLGDSDKDLGAAMNAGVDSVLFYPPSHEPIYDLTYLKSFKPVYVAGSWKELLGPTS